MYIIWKEVEQYTLDYKTLWPIMTILIDYLTRLRPFGMDFLLCNPFTIDIGS